MLEHPGHSLDMDIPPVVTSIAGPPYTTIGGTMFYNIGANFCLDFVLKQRAFIRCDINIFNTATAYPTPRRTWVKDGLVVYSDSGQGTAFFNDTFLLSGDNSLFMPLVIFPPPLNIWSYAATGSIGVDTTAENLTFPLTPSGVNLGNFRRVTFEALLGNYGCTVDNVFGGDSAISSISECGELGPPPSTIELSLVASLQRHNSLQIQVL